MKRPAKPVDLKEVRKQKEREDYKHLVLDAWDRFDRADRHEFLDTKLEVERKAKGRL